MFRDKIAVAKFEALQKQFGFEICYETGTNAGFGSVAASRFCDVVTIEIDPDRQQRSVYNWLLEGFALRYQDDCVIASQNGRVIRSYRGNSPEVLRRVAAQEHAKPPCFYLDAHWGEYWPLLDELKVIAELNHRNSIIIIHDFKVPGKPWSYCSYSGHDLDYAYVEDALNAINPRFRITYNEEASGNQCGILYATP